MTVEQILQSNSATGTKIVLCPKSKKQEIRQRVSEVPGASFIKYSEVIPFIEGIKNYVCCFVLHYSQIVLNESLIKEHYPKHQRVMFLIDTPAYSSLEHNVANWSDVEPFDHPKVDDNLAKYSGYTPAQWALLWIERYGQVKTDSLHYKYWLLDQVARILNGTPVLVGDYKSANGTVTEQFSLGEPSEKYNQWVTEMKDGEYKQFAIEMTEAEQYIMEIKKDKGVAP